jgi:hypothetical protein
MSYSGSRRYSSKWQWDSIGDSGDDIQSKWQSSREGGKAKEKTSSRADDHHQADDRLEGFVYQKLIGR